MTIFDRYLSLLFLKTTLVCFSSFAGLFVVVHVFSNLDELTAISQTIGWMGVFQEFYLPRFADLFDKSAGIVILVSAIFSISMLQRRRELTAVEANGLTKLRMLRSVFVLSAIFIGMTIANRELLIPRLKSKLVQTPQSWGANGETEMKVQTDLTTGVVLRGDKVKVGDGRITKVNVQLPHTVATILPRVRAGWGEFHAANDMHPKGLWLHQVSNIDQVDEVGSLKDSDGELVLFSRADQKWLGPNQCFVRCNFELEEVAYGNQLAEYQSTMEMIDRVRGKSPTQRAVRKDQVAIHARFVKPLLDMALLLLGLPVVIGGIERNVFVSAGICFWVVVAVQLSVIVCYALGASSLIRPPALAAWIPVMVFVPLASISLRRLKR